MKATLLLHITLLACLLPASASDSTNTVTGAEKSAGGGDIISKERFSEFELTAEFKITQGANSGINYLVQPDLKPIDKVTGKPTPVGSAIGLEFQILDDANHPDAKLGKKCRPHHRRVEHRSERRLQTGQTHVAQS